MTGPVYILTQEQMDIMNPYQRCGDLPSLNLGSYSASSATPIEMHVLCASAMAFTWPRNNKIPVRTGYTGANAVYAYEPNWCCANCHKPWGDNTTECSNCGHWEAVDL